MQQSQCFQTLFNHVFSDQFGRFLAVVTNLGEFVFSDACFSRNSFEREGKGGEGKHAKIGHRRRLGVRERHRVFHIAMWLIL